VRAGEGRPGGRKKRFEFVDQFRGLVGIMMALGHSSYYFNSLWLWFDPIDPLIPNFGQFALRYMGYLCAPGFLMMNGAMTWYAYQRRRRGGGSDSGAKWHLIQRGLFLVLVQVTWVNASWGGFASFKPDHLGIIACIGLSMCFLALFVHTRWYIRLGVGLAAFALHPFLLKIDYDPTSTWQLALMQTFVDAGEFNKYPVIPWFGLAVMGSVMATAWIELWKTTQERFWKSLAVGALAIALATAVRMGRGFGNIFPFSTLGHYSFFLDQKYPPSLYHNLWFFGAVVLTMSVIILIVARSPRILSALGAVGRVPLFFYCVHIAILGVFVKRIGIYYREGDVAASLVGWVVLLLVMYPLVRWFGKVKERSKNYIIRLI
jgi:uncharacterized membrane protein